jgi:hypothetical protein
VNCGSVMDDGKRSLAILVRDVVPVLPFVASLQVVPHLVSCNENDRVGGERKVLQKALVVAGCFGALLRRC